MGQIKKFIEFCKELDIDSKSDFAVEVYLRHERLNTISDDDTEAHRCRFCNEPTEEDEFCCGACELSHNTEARKEREEENRFEYERGN